MLECLTSSLRAPTFVNRHIMNIRKIRKIDYLIQNRRTGNPNEFAKKVSCSRRMLFKYLKFMKLEMDAPIEYSRIKETYMYGEDGKLGVNGFFKELV